MAELAQLANLEKLAEGGPDAAESREENGFEFATKLQFCRQIPRPLSPKTHSGRRSGQVKLEQIKLDQAK
ncbi:hypothetical protein NE619_15535 [Anaerovorax odorimutans]|uniref:Uncharacterized protein n=1 Tax=Anaerovorax odorimutans TaxID=109327 RepID=A0ABT1RSK0_9FIRM|nr:hypothetical protein [Anaerovorax odorimutans]